MAQFALTMSALVIVITQAGLRGAQQSLQDLAQQIFDTMLEVPGTTAGYRVVHAKGIVCEGTFTASKEASAISRAAQFKGGTVPLTIRFSDAAPSPTIPDSSPDAQPRGMAIRFNLSKKEKTDIVAFAHNGFVVGTGEDFLALEKAVVATDPSKAHPWPIEAFLGTHPRALQFVQDPKPTPTSFSSEAFYGNNAFVFVNKSGAKQPVRYQILPVAGKHYLSDADAKAKSPDFLFEELRSRLPKEPAKFRLVVQLPAAGDTTNDSTIVRPEDRKTVELGTITVTSVVVDSDSAQKALAFDPTNLTDGIELSDDPIPALRRPVYMLSVMHRSGK
jgi:catalase